MSKNPSEGSSVVAQKLEINFDSKAKTLCLSWEGSPVRVKVNTLFDGSPSQAETSIPDVNPALAPWNTRTLLSEVLQNGDFITLFFYKPRGKRKP